MPHTAVLLMDLQVDFLDSARGRMPVGDEGAARVLQAASTVLAGEAIPGAMPVVIKNEFPASQVLANFFRRNAALAGSAGAELDPRLLLPAGTPVFSKTQPSAFSNPELHPFLQSKSVSRVCIIGVFAEGCVRATALAAKSLGYTVLAPLEAIATNARWKLRFATSSMRRRGVLLPSTVQEVESVT